MIQFWRQAEERGGERWLETEGVAGRYCSMIKLFMAEYHEVGKKKSSRGHDVSDNHHSTSETGLELILTNFTQALCMLRRNKTFTEPPDIDLTPSTNLLLYGLRVPHNTPFVPPV